MKSLSLFSPEWFTQFVSNHFANGGFDNVTILRDVKADGANGGQATSGVFVTRDLNTVVGKSVPLSSNQFTLEPGKYLCFLKTPAYQVTGHRAKIQNLTASQSAIQGSLAYTGNASTVQTNSIGFGIIDISVQSIFELQHIVNSAGASVDFGNNSSFGEGNNIFSEVYLMKISD